jgi:hypothetical protein
MEIKPLLIWLAVTTIVLILGFTLLMYGGVYGDPGLNPGGGFIYKIEVIIGKILLWPLFSSLYIWDTLAEKNNIKAIPLWYSLASHYIGYSIAFYVYLRIKMRKNNHT